MRYVDRKRLPGIPGIETCILSRELIFFFPVKGLCCGLGGRRENGRIGREGQGGADLEELEYLLLAYCIVGGLLAWWSVVWCYREGRAERRSRKTETHKKGTGADDTLPCNTRRIRAENQKRPATVTAP